MNEELFAPKRVGLRKTEPLSRGFSQMDWAREASASGRMRGKLRPLTWEEVERHNNISMDAWMVLRGKVYDITRYVPYHPGGKDELMRAIGDDGTELFDEIHSWVSESMIDHLAVGYISNSAEPVGRPSITNSIKQRPKSAGRSIVDKSDSSDYEYHKCVVVERIELKCCRYCFVVKFQSDAFKSNNSLALPGCVIKLKTNIGTKLVERPFTPFLTGDSVATEFKSQEDEVLVLVKAYEDGIMTKHLRICEVGTSFKYQVRVPTWHMKDEQRTLMLHVKGAAGFRKRVGDGIQFVCMIAAGTGIMPMIQVMGFLSRKQADLDVLPRVSLLFINRTNNDIILKSAIENFQKNHSDSLVKTNFLTTESKGRIDKNEIAKFVNESFGVVPVEEGLPEPVRFMVCGSAAFNRHITDSIKELGWSPDACFSL